MGSIISRPVVTSVGVLYPAYASFKALETPATDDDKQWLTYWVVFSITSSAEEVAERVVSYLPGYYVLKCIFLVWLMLPKTRGAIIVYDKYLQPLLKQYEPLLDAKLAAFKTYQGLTISIEKAMEVQEAAAKSPLKAKVADKMAEIKSKGLQMTSDSVAKIKAQVSRRKMSSSIDADVDAEPEATE
ncbi:hypothetical protein SPRG_22323 [Saprolegnia parasitica CBS 223.65]|uniref:HVA22-like protein n=1 Tax=Saprolegnia parasitica (strain CBS 223.65) TaxID=695850 RepID=A0A067C174_SAPPC|nr:hypothetical protein SPRG_22323 [Saprolegnia parasitica CBS 223.65]KDO20562.1 hypothetical protein SPRG_22323 [Saprolegnia parasitica CBS 223.65]|eukprot:XP_012208763.1 hypothetical protein SPRG_22323 [Saprolegnia parasitica CBS 223.65]